MKKALRWPECPRVHTWGRNVTHLAPAVGLAERSGELGLEFDQSVKSAFELRH